MSRPWLEGEFAWAWKEGPILGAVLMYERRHPRGITLGIGLGICHFAITVRF